MTNRAAGDQRQAFPSFHAAGWKRICGVTPAAVAMLIHHLRSDVHVVVVVAAAVVAVTRENLLLHWEMWEGEEREEGGRRGGTRQPTRR